MAGWPAGVGYLLSVGPLNYLQFPVVDNLPEGLPAIIMGVATLFILPDYPQTAKFLSERERDAIINRLSEDAPTKASKTWDSDQVRRLLTDPTFYTFNFVWLCHAIGGLGLTYVLPTVIFQ